MKYDLDDDKQVYTVSRIAEGYDFEVVFRPDFLGRQFTTGFSFNNFADARGFLDDVVEYEFIEKFVFSTLRFSSNRVKKSS